MRDVETTWRQCFQSDLAHGDGDGQLTRADRAVRVAWEHSGSWRFVMLLGNSRLVFAFFQSFRALKRHEQLFTPLIESLHQSADSVFDYFFILYSLGRNCSAMRSVVRLEGTQPDGDCLAPEITTLRDRQRRGLAKHARGIWSDGGSRQAYIYLRCWILDVSGCYW